MGLWKVLKILAFQTAEQMLGKSSFEKGQLRSRLVTFEKKAQRYQTPECNFIDSEFGWISRKFLFRGSLPPIQKALTDFVSADPKFVKLRMKGLALLSPPSASS